MINRKRLSVPLQPYGSAAVPGDNQNGKLQFKDVLGKPARTLYCETGSKSKSNKYAVVTRPTLDEYILFTRRNVTPVYAAYASHIVSLLDINPPTPTTTSGHSGKPERLEILEAGTGHGSLTIHLARAIAAGNKPPPGVYLPEERHTEASLEQLSEEWASWLNERQAIVHTVETTPKCSRDAETLIRGFRQGLYWPHVNFYTGDVDEWLQNQLRDRGEEEKEFLDYVVLDMPAVEQRLSNAAKAMKEDGLLACFCPSITQIAACQQLIKKQGIPLTQVQTVELGEGISTGRVWDVRVVIPRKELADLERLKAIKSSSTIDEGPHSDAGEDGDQDDIDQEIADAEAAVKDTKWVCRPKVWERTFGGGFVGIWRKSTPRKVEEEKAVEGGEEVEGAKKVDE